MTQSIVQVDAFTNKLFAGNPAAVCVLPIPADETWMKNVASEMNLSETVFVLPDQNAECAWQLRIFSPQKELMFVGHPVIAAGYVLAMHAAIPPGQLPIRLHDEIIELDIQSTPGAGSRFAMVFPEFRESRQREEIEV